MWKNLFEENSRLVFKEPTITHDFFGIGDIQILLIRSFIPIMRAAFAKDAMDQTGWIPPGATPTRITDPSLLFFHSWLANNSAVSELVGFRKPFLGEPYGALKQIQNLHITSQ